MYTPSNRKHSPPRYRRRSPARLAHAGWGNGHSIWDTDDTARPHSVDHIAITTAPPPPRIAEALQLAPSTDTVIRRRRYLVDIRPIQYATSYYSALIAAGTPIAEPDTGPGGAYARLAELGHPPAHFREEIQVRPPRDAEATLLHLAAHVQVYDVVRTAFTASGYPIEVTEMTLDSSAYVLEYTFSTTT